jgi:hypothetical protein
MLYRTYALSTRRPSDIHSAYTDATHQQAQPDACGTSPVVGEDTSISVVVSLVKHRRLSDSL